MASRRFDAITTRGLQRVSIGGSFSPNGTSAPTNVLGNGFTVARTDVGTYLITFADNFFAMEQSIGTVRRWQTLNGTVQFGTYDATARTLVMRVFGQDQAYSRHETIPLQLESARIITASGNYPNTAAGGGLVTSNTSQISIQTTGGLDSRLVFAAGATNVATWGMAIPGSLLDGAINIRVYARIDGVTDVNAEFNGSLYYGSHPDPDTTIVIPTATLVPGVYQLWEGEFDGPPSTDNRYRGMHFVLQTASNPTDSISVSGVEFSYIRNEPPGMDPIDLPADANNVISFNCLFRNTGVTSR